MKEIGSDTWLAFSFLHGHGARRLCVIRKQNSQSKVFKSFIMRVWLKWLSLSQAIKVQRKHYYSYNCQYCQAVAKLKIENKNRIHVT